MAVKKLQTSGAPVAEEALFLKEVQTLQLASYACQRVCRMIGCCKLDGDACIVMSLYSKSAAKRLEEGQGQCSNLLAYRYCLSIVRMSLADLQMHGDTMESMQDHLIYSNVH